MITSTKLNRNAEKLPSASTNDLISEEDHSLIKKAAESGDERTLCSIDILFSTHL